MSLPVKTTSRIQRIAANLSQEIKYWANILGCSEVEVMPAVKEMLGISPTKKQTAVNHLKKKYRMA